MLILKIGRRGDREVRDLAEASRIYCRERDESNEGGSTWPDGKIEDDRGNHVAHISYNGRVWTKSCGELLLEAQA